MENLLSEQTNDSPRELNIIRIAQNVAEALLYNDSRSSLWASPRFRVALNLFCKLQGNENMAPDEGYFMRFLSLLERPLIEWGFPGTEEWFQPDEKLMVDGEPTQVAIELCGSGRDLEGNWTEAWMKEWLDWCRLHGKQELYERVRLIIIERPVLTSREHFDLVQSTDFEDQAWRFKGAYEDIPAEFVHNGTVHLCGYCGWTLKRVNGEFRCHSSICRSRTSSFHVRRELPYGSGMKRLTIGLARYVTGPGRAEAHLYQWLRKQSVGVRLYPNIDMCDMEAAVGGRRVAIDVKDWGNPFLLARSLSVVSSEWDQVVIVVPDDRCKAVRGYTRIVTTMSRLKCSSMSEFKRFVNQGLERDA